MTLMKAFVFGKIPNGVNYKKKNGGKDSDSEYRQLFLRSFAAEKKYGNYENRNCLMAMITNIYQN